MFVFPRKKYLLLMPYLVTLQGHNIIFRILHSINEYRNQVFEERTQNSYALNSDLSQVKVTTNQYFNFIQCTRRSRELI